MNLGSIGIWSGAFRAVEPEQATDAAAELEQLGYGAIWLPGGTGGPVLELAQRLLEATSRIVVATGVLNIWAHEAADVRAARAKIEAEHEGRFLLGLGVSHKLLVERENLGVYARPLSKMRSYLDELDEEPDPVPPEGRVLAALGPFMLQLASVRSAGAHPYLVPVGHTIAARALLGDGPLLAPELAVSLKGSAEANEAVAREHVQFYLRLPNYTRNLLRHGLTREDLRDGGSRRLVDALVAGGGVEGISARVRAHRDAGADHVCLQVLGSPAGQLPREEWRTLAQALL